MRLTRSATVLAVLAVLVAAVTSHDIEKRQTRRLRTRPGILKRRKNPNSSVAVSDPTLPGKRVVCYYTNWSVYRKGLAKFVPQNINPYLCTHLVYAFGGLTDEFEITASDSYQDIEKGGYSQFIAIKQYNKQLRTLIAIGGWVEGSSRFSEMVSIPELRQHFIASAIRHLRRYNFDGLDLDWEYPASRSGSQPEDKENYAILVQELRVAFEEESSKSGRPRLLLTMAVPAGQSYIDNGYDIPSLNANLDFFNILTYDYHTSMDPVVRNHAALLALPGTTEYEESYKLNVDWTVKHYMQLGADPLKLVVGIPTYGRSFKLADPLFNEIGSSAIGAGDPGNYTNEKGFLAFYEVCEAMSTAGWSASKPYPRSVGPYAYSGDQWVGYDDEATVATKAEYVRDTGLGGIMFWTLDTDDFRGHCNGSPYPLVEAGKAALLSDPPTDVNTLDGRRPPASIAPPVTPSPPTTPSPSGVFDCRREGRNPNPDNCHQFFWCLPGGPGQGIVAHTFTCPADLIFSKSIDNCAHPSVAKCNEKKNRGGAAEKATTPAIPTTTPFPEFDYDYYYYYDDEEYVDTPSVAATEPAQLTTERSLTTVAQRTPSRNSGGAQFSRPQEVGGGGAQRQRPQYTSIIRNRHEADIVVDAAEAPAALGGNNGRRPQYTSITRDRPVTETPPEEEVLQSSQGGNINNRLNNYVTIERNRPVTTPGTADIGVVESSTSASLQYVTLNRSGSRTTESSSQGIVHDDSPNLITIDSDSFSSRRPVRVETTPEITSTTTTTTTTPRPARIVVPQILLEPVTPKVTNRLLLDPRIRERKRLQERQEVVQITQRTVTEAAPDTTTELSLDDYLYEYEYIYDDLEDLAVNTTDSDTNVVLETDVVQPSLSDGGSPVVESPIDTSEKEIKVQLPELTTEAVSLKTTINLLATFQALTTSAPDIESKHFEESRTAGGAPAPDQVTALQEVVAPQLGDPVTEKTPTRQVPQLPPRPRRPTEANRVTTHQKERHPLLTSRFTPQGSGSQSSRVDDTTRRSPFQRPTQRTTDNRNRDRQPTRFTSRPVQVRKEGSAQTEQFNSNDAIRNRFRTRPTTQNRFRLNPIAVITSTPPVTRTRRPRPTSDRINTRTKPRIRFRHKEEPTTQLAVEVTEQPILEDEVALSESGTTPNDVFAAIFGEGDTIYLHTTTGTTTSPILSTHKQPVDHRILDHIESEAEIEKETEHKVSQTPATDAPFRFEDFFTPTTTSIADIVEVPVTTGSTTTVTITTTSPTTTIGTTTPRSRKTVPPTVISEDKRRVTSSPPFRGPPRLPPPTSTTTSRPSIPRRGGRPPKARSSTLRPPSQIADYVYDYFYDEATGALGGTLGELAELTEKALLLPGGKVKCYDTGYFAHPESCKKFISCSKTVRGAVRGWVYTCPQQLVFDPVGGMCNWAEAVDCKAPII